jgi:hypothetical protein
LFGPRRRRGGTRKATETTTPEATAIATTRRTRTTGEWDRRGRGGKEKEVDGKGVRDEEQVRRKERKGKKRI